MTGNRITHSATNPSMTHEVFISYSSVDKTADETVYSLLEQNGISCCISPRDIIPGLEKMGLPYK